MPEPERKRDKKKRSKEWRDLDRNMVERNGIELTDLNLLSIPKNRLTMPASKDSKGQELVDLKDIHAGADFKYTPTKTYNDYFSSEKAGELIIKQRKPGSLKMLQTLASQLNQMFESDFKPIVLYKTENYVSLKCKFSKCEYAIWYKYEE